MWHQSPAQVGDVEIDKNIGVEVNHAVDFIFRQQFRHQQAVECADTESAFENLRNFFGEEFQTVGHERGDVIKFNALIIFAGNVIEFIAIIERQRLIVEYVDGELFARILENRRHRCADEF